MTPREPEPRKAIVVIGIGNPMRRDDGVGPAVICATERDLAESCDLLELDGEATRLIEEWCDRQLAIVVDAVCTGEPVGTIHDLRVDQLDMVKSVPSSTSSHYAGLAEALTLGQALDRLPESLRVVGIEPGDLKYGMGFSPEVEASLDEVIDRVRIAVAEADTQEPQ